MSWMYAVFRLEQADMCDVILICYMCLIAVSPLRSTVLCGQRAGERQRIAGSLGYRRPKSSPDVWPVLCECFLRGALPEIKSGQKYQGSKNPGRQLARSTEFCTVTLNICAFSE